MPGAWMPGAKYFGHGRWKRVSELWRPTSMNTLHQFSGGCWDSLDELTYRLALFSRMNTKK